MCENNIFVLIGHFVFPIKNIALSLKNIFNFYAH